MSGIETAGLILSGFPLIISALEHYRDGFKPLQEWWSFESEFCNFIEELGTQQTRFDMNLEKLLDPFVTSDCQMNALLDQGNPKGWGDPKVMGQIYSRLGNSYEWYIAICRKIKMTLEGLEEKLGIVNGQVRYIDSSRWDHELRRLRISFSRKKFKHVKLLTKYNDDLQQLLSSSDELGPSRQRRRKAPMITLLRSLQQHSQYLYSGLLSRFQCKCTATHDTKFLLESHTTEDDARNLNLYVFVETASIRKPMKIQIEELNTSQDAYTLEEPSNSNLLELRSQVHDRTVNVQSSSSQLPTISRGLQSMTLTSSSPGQASPRSAFRKFSLSSQKPKKTARFGPGSAPPPSDLQSLPTNTQVVEIQDVCSEIPSIGSIVDCISYIPTAATSRLLFYPDAHHPVPDGDCQFVTLNDLLSSSRTSSNSGDIMTRKQRFHLANTLAYTLLQLQPTSWLSSSWNKNDITFPRSPSSPINLLSHPYISKTFPCTATVKTVTTEDCKQSLFRFGILLLELTFNKQLETLPIRQKYLGPEGVPNEYTDLCTAKEWHRAVEGECGEGLSEAIRRCIDCSFGSKPDWNNDLFLEEYFGLVVEPLRNLLRQWEGTI